MYGLDTQEIEEMSELDIDNVWSGRFRDIVDRAAARITLGKATIESGSGLGGVGSFFFSYRSDADSLLRGLNFTTGLVLRKDLLLALSEGTLLPPDKLFARRNGLLRGFEDLGTGLNYMPVKFVHRGWDDLTPLSGEKAIRADGMLVKASVSTDVLWDWINQPERDDTLQYILTRKEVVGFRHHVSPSATDTRRSGFPKQSEILFLVNL